MRLPHTKIPPTVARRACGHTPFSLREIEDGKPDGVEVCQRNRVSNRAMLANTGASLLSRA